MNILTIDNITKSYGVRKIFDGASFFLQEGEKAGIIGINGTGKSTLLKMIAGLEEADDGTVIKANHCLVRYLPQNPEFAPEETCWRQCCVAIVWRKTPEPSRLMPKAC